VERRQALPKTDPYADVQVELTLLTYRRLTTTVILGGVGMVGTVALLAHHYADRWMWAIDAAMLVAASARLLSSVAFSMRGDEPLSVSAARRWQMRYGAATLAYCFMLAASTLYVFRYHDETGRSLSMLGTFAISAGLSARVGMRPWFVHWCGDAMLGALAFSMLVWDDGLVRVGSILIVFLCISHHEAAQNKFDILVEQIRLRRQFRELAEQDTLTGLANRRQFQASLAAACVAGTPFAILFIDLDRFKGVNDSYGHAAGDKLLQLVAQRLRATVRSRDLVARLGGDEFAILQAPVATIASAQALAERVVQQIAAPFEIDGQPVEIGASVGVQLSQEGERDTNRLLNTADAALYRVKEAGGGSFFLAEQ
jgi:diguanylate cyclase (GGDEF)-like protein